MTFLVDLLRYHFIQIKIYGHYSPVILQWHAKFEVGWFPVSEKLCEENSITTQKTYSSDNLLT